MKSARGFTLPRGFTLLEVLVAFAVLATAAGLLLGIVSGGVHQVQESARASEAAALAQTLAAGWDLDEPLRPGERQGESEDGRYRWTLSVLEIAEPPEPEAEAGLEPGAEESTQAPPAPEEEPAPLEEAEPLALLRIELVVAWGEDERQRVRFATWRLRPQAAAP